LASVKAKKKKADRAVVREEAAVECLGTLVVSAVVESF
jgi:hypothetical protein